MIVNLCKKHDKATLYENIITTSERSFYVPVICVRGNNVFGYCKGSSGRISDLKSHMDTVFKNAGHSVTFKVFDDESAFINRAKQLTETYTSITNGDFAVMETIKAVSL